MTKASSPFLILIIAGMLSRLSYQMARSPVLPRFAQDLGSSPELIGLIVAASTITGIFIKLDTHAFQVHTALNLIAHLVSSWSKGLSRFSNTINEKEAVGL